MISRTTGECSYFTADFSHNHPLFISPDALLVHNYQLCYQADISDIETGNRISILCSSFVLLMSVRRTSQLARTPLDCLCLCRTEVFHKMRSLYHLSCYLAIFVSTTMCRVVWYAIACHDLELQRLRVSHFNWLRTVLLSIPWALISFLYFDSILPKSFEATALSRSPSISATSRRL